MDGFELNKIAGAVLFALLILFGTRTLADIIFAVHAPEKPGWEVAIPESAEGPATAEAEAEKVEPIAVRLASASVEKGESVHKKCTTCHSFEAGGPNKIGPNLHGVVGNEKAAHEGFSYSDAMKSKGGKWTYEELDQFLANPKGYVPGTKMAFAGVKDAGQRADLILYLRSLDENPPPLPEAPPAEAKQAEKPAVEGGEKPAEGAAPAGEKPAEGEKKPAPAGEKPAAEGEKPAGEAQQPAQGAQKPAAEGEKPAEGAAQEQKPAETEDSKTSAPQATEPAQPETVPGDKAEPRDQQTPPAVPAKPDG